MASVNVHFGCSKLNFGSATTWNNIKLLASDEWTNASISEIILSSSKDHTIELVERDNMFCLIIDGNIQNRTMLNPHTENICIYTKNTNIKLDKIIEYIPYTYHDYANRCVECHLDLGESNPRQYCCKTYCNTAQEIFCDA